ncbi:hypothetical protein TWF730_008819 [Orbilia blumenaviensis]|uniref:Uncharacterized protein n=1 Tax=Orbilia blumenaviensis TaxID=1796055 RepID=A0AAV9V548_9PEZI
MVDYTLSVTVEDVESVTGYNLCLLKAMQAADSDNDIYNVVFESSGPNDKIVFNWTDEYKICCSPNRFKNAETVQATTGKLAISFKQRFSIMGGWDTTTVEDDDKIEAESFEFRSGVLGASAIVSLRSSEGSSPFFQSPNPLLRGTTESFTPKDKYKVLWSKKHKAGRMVGSESEDGFEIDFTGKRSCQVVFTKDQSWNIVAYDS